LEENGEGTSPIEVNKRSTKPPLELRESLLPLRLWYFVLVGCLLGPALNNNVRFRKGCIVRTVVLTLSFGLVTSAANVVGGQSTDKPRAAVTSAVLTGIVKDEYGEPIPSARISVERSSITVQTDTLGVFRVETIPGDYNVVFRHLGYEPADFSWRAVSGQAIDLSIRLNRIPQGLDTVVIHDSHNRASGTSFMKGVVLDANLQPLPGAELQLIGTGHHAMSYASGEFFFAALSKGTYILRARRMGYSPANVTLRIESDEKSDIAVTLTPLPNTLPTVEIREQSGFARSNMAWQEFDQRQRWKSSVSSLLVTRDDLAGKGKMPLDLALEATAAAGIMKNSSGRSRSLPTSIRPGSNNVRLSALSEIANDVCVLVNGLKADRRSLSLFSADEVERVEVIGANSDWTGTVGARMLGVSGCQQEGLKHPIYFVVWLRGDT
jgi:hypothetical protein